MIELTFWHNATAKLEVDGRRILLDPWLVKDSPPFMSWYHWPPLPDDVIEQVGDCDVIWISHCHEDHYHLPSLRAYMRRWGEKPIATETMKDRAVADGFKLGRVENSATFVAENGIDSALAVWAEDKSTLVNLTDVHYDQAMIDKIKRWCGGSPTIALIPFAGAGPWPQTYYSDPEVLAQKAKEKQVMFVERFVQFRDALQPKVAIPFAGQYALGGSLAHLNKWRGMNDAVDMPEPRFVLPMGEEAWYEDGQLEISGERFVRLPEATDGVFAYEADEPHSNVEIENLLVRAWDLNPIERMHVSVSWGDVENGDGGWWYKGSTHSPRSLDISIGRRLLYRLLTGQMHWADADAGSLYQIRRNPDVYDKAVHDWLWNFHV